MAVLKLSQIASAGSPPALTDTVIGVGSGTTDLQYTLTQIKSTVAPVGANPSATASDTAVNGSAATFMRSDGAPAIQKTSASVFGLCKVDGSTITATAGVISSVGGVATSIDAAGATSITNGTSTHVLYDNAGVVGESSQFTISSGQPNVTSGHKYFYNGVGIISADTTNNNYWIAANAGNFTASGTDNYMFGLFSGVAITSGVRNIAIGSSAFSTATADNNCIAIGYNSLGVMNNTTQGNIAIGSGTLSAATGGSSNVAIGMSAMGVGVNTGSNNGAIGNAALQANTSGHDNFAMGANAFTHNTTGTNNLGVGASAGAANISGSNIVAIGSQSVATATADDDNIGIGAFALNAANGGGRNIGIGYGAGQSISTGGTNLILSFNESTITSGSGNIAIGNSVGVASATASNQLVIGNYIYGTGLAGTGATISTAKIGIGIKAPAFNLDVAGSIGQADAAALIHTTGALNNGAGTGTGVTFTNAPGSSLTTGNPTKWIPIDDNGVTRYVPAF